MLVILILSGLFLLFFQSQAIVCIHVQQATSPAAERKLQLQKIELCESFIKT